MTTDDGPEAWASEAGPPTLREGTSTVTLLEGSSFCLSSINGDIDEGRVSGMFVWDTRIVSRWRLLVDGTPVEPLCTVEKAPYAATFVGRAPPRPGRADSTLLVLRERQVASGMREDLVLRNHANEAASVVLVLEADCDFADLFEVKEQRVVRRPRLHVEVVGNALVHSSRGGLDTRSTTVLTTGADSITARRVTYRAVVPPRGEWRTTLTVSAAVDGRTVGPSERPARRDAAQQSVAVPGRRAADRLAAWRRSLPVMVTGDPLLGRILRCTRDDLGALQIEDPEQPGRRVVAAGAPWFMALFGRDALLTSWMALPLDQDLAVGTLEALARFQGTKDDPVTEEQPGRILHEVRLGAAAALALGGGQTYYGTADATPLFVALLGELYLWGVPLERLEPLLPAADRALAWIARAGDADGFVQYRRMTDQGLANQGWKDSFDGINHASGRLAVPPIALAEVQGYVYSALLGRARLAEGCGDPTTSQSCRDRALVLKKAFNERFWLPERGWFAVGLDGDKQPIDALTSNVGHCLWTGIIDEDKAAALVDNLMSPTMWSGFGIRTLDARMGAFNPMSYHNGSVWPHDSAIVAAGLLRYGFVEAGHQVALGLLDAADRSGGRLPELFCGFSREEYADPVPYPTSCSPQAWSAAAPLLLLRSLMGFEPDLPAGTVRLAPVVPASLLPLRIENLPLGTARITVAIDADGCHVEGLPSGIALELS